jgi:hypothetical protein
VPTGSAHSDGAVTAGAGAGQCVKLTAHIDALRERHTVREVMWGFMTVFMDPDPAAAFSP